MKKLLAIIISSVLLIAVMPTAFAVSPIESINGQDSKSVKGTYEAGGLTQTVYSVDIKWGSMEFKYTDLTEGTWNPADHSYDGTVNAVWSCVEGANKITVINHSNAPVKATLSYTPESAYSEIGGTFSNNELTLPTAVGTANDSAPQKDAALTLNGALKKDTANEKIGTVTVSLDNN